jgi:hypothetical protein
MNPVDMFALQPSVHLHFEAVRCIAAMPDQNRRLSQITMLAPASTKT